MRVHLVTDQFNLGGGLEHIYQIARGLKDFHFRIFADGGDAAEKFNHLENVDVYDNGYAPGDLLAGEPDVIHFHHLRPLLTFFKNPFACYDVPVVFTVHGLHIHKYEFFSTLKSRLGHFFRFQLEKRLFRKPNRVIAVSREDKAFMETQYRLKDVKYLTNGIDFSAVVEGAEERKSRDELRKRLGLSVDEFLFVTVARFNFQKGYDIFFQALWRLKEFLKGKRCRFLLVGDGEIFDEMKALAGELGIDEYVTFLGARKDVYDLVAAGDVFLLPSRWEGLPIVLLEAGLLKAPVLASDTYGNREILGNGRGVLYRNLDVGDLAETIKGALDGKYDLEGNADALFKEIGEGYSLDKMLAGLCDLYSELKA